MRLRRRLHFAFVFAFACIVPAFACLACNDSEPETPVTLREETKSCKTWCENLETTCPESLEKLKGNGCTWACDDPVDGSADYWRCAAEANSCKTQQDCIALLPPS